MYANHVELTTSKGLNTKISTLSRTLASSNHRSFSRMLTYLSHLLLFWRLIRKLKALHKGPPTEWRVVQERTESTDVNHHTISSIAKLVDAMMI